VKQNRVQGRKLIAWVKKSRAKEGGIAQKGKKKREKEWNEGKEETQK
jgi:post-segregation antitoxin (ccd killing protein)